MPSNPYESPRCSVPEPHSRRQLLPSIPELAFLAILAASSILIHRTHGDISNWVWSLKIPGIGGATIGVLVGSAALLSLGGCATTSICRRSNRWISILAYIVGIVTATTMAVLLCWLLMSTRQPPSGAAVFISVVAGMLSTGLILMVPTDLRSEAVGTLVSWADIICPERTENPSEVDCN